MRRYIFLLLAIVSATFQQAHAQDDLLNMLDDEPTAKPVYATFKSTRVINLHSNEMMRAKHLDFRIQHRFSAMDISANNVYGLYNLFGLDGAQIRIGLEYGVSDKLMLGAGRSTLGKAYDGFVKYQLLRQTKGKKSLPFGLTYFGNVGINTVEWADKTRENLFSSRLSFVNQLIVTSKVNDYLSLCISPTLVHHNLVQTKTQPNDVYAIGLGASIKISRSTRFNIEYIPRLNGRDEPLVAGNNLYYDSFSFGFDIETGGHVFQLHFTNASGLIEQQFISQNINPLNLNSVRLGFNISRTFSFDKH